MDAAKRLDVAIAAGMRILFGLNFGGATRKARCDARKSIPPCMDLLVPGRLGALKPVIGKDARIRQQISVACERGKTHLARLHLRECDRCRVGFGGDEIQRQLRFFRPLAEHAPTDTAPVL